QHVVVEPLFVGGPHRPPLRIDLLDSHTKPGLNRVAAVPVDIVQDDVVEILLAGEHAGEQDAIVIDVRLLPDHRDVEGTPMLQKLFDKSDASHAIAGDHNVFFHVSAQCHLACVKADSSQAWRSVVLPKGRASTCTTSCALAGESAYPQ